MGEKKRVEEWKSKRSFLNKWLRKLELDFCLAAFACSPPSLRVCVCLLLFWFPLRNWHWQFEPTSCLFSFVFARKTSTLKLTESFGFFRFLVPANEPNIFAPYFATPTQSSASLLAFYLVPLFALYLRNYTGNPIIRLSLDFSILCPLCMTPLCHITTRDHQNYHSFATCTRPNKV